MKRFTMILALLLMAAMPMMAERVTPEVARKVATTFLNNNGVKSNQLVDLSRAAGFPNLYIFTTENSFVVMSADDCVKPILGYSLTGTFVTENMPTNVKGWLQGYNDEIQYAIDSKMSATTETAKLWKDMAEGNAKAGKATVVVDALVKTQWDQGSPYNNLCPSGTVTGCVATAMAQIMKFWEYPIQGTSSHSYTWNSQSLSANFGNTTYDWANMTNTYTSSNSNAENTAVATLMYHCGVSIDMNYGTTSSASTAAVVSALKNYFKYSSTAQYKNKSSFNDAQWISMLKDEINAGRPLQYRGSNAGGSGGHSFVCDGYDNEDLFHFNWGWGGFCDGFYALTNMEPGTGGIGAGIGVYTVNQAAIFGIQPQFNNQYAPSNLTASLSQSTGFRNVNLSWTAATSSSSYKVYRNNTLLATVSSTELTYTDVHIPYGTNTYYVRSLDANGNLSESSNSETITITFPTPNNLSAQLTNNTVVLTWDGVEQAVSYNVYCNNVIVDNVDDISYTHNNPPYGELAYYVKGVDDLGDESDASNTEVVTHTFYGPIVTDLDAVVNNNNIQLSWTALLSESATLQHINPSNYTQWSSTSYYSSTIGDTYWGVRFPASILGNYAGMAINSITFYVAQAGTYNVNVYQCTGSVPSGNPIYSTNNISLSNWSRKQLSFTPQYLDYTKDLWIIINTSGVQFAACGTPDISIEEGNYMSLDGSSWMHTSHTWFITAGITDGTYTYNIYRNGEAIATEMSGTTYTDQNRNNAANYYTVTTNYFGGESAASNGVGYTLSVGTLPSLSLTANDQMTLTEGSNLTVSGNLINTNPDNLILENGAQLIHNSADVQATVKKTIEPYTADDNGWYFIASPIAGNTIPSENNGFLNGTPGQNNNTYDLYYYDEPSQQWKNHESQSFEIENQKGYLYANGETNGTTLQFSGTLSPSNESITINNLSHSATILNGFNLVGNPFACNATINQDCYVIEGSQVVLATTAPVLAPCEGVMVKATNESSSVTFTKASNSKGNNSKDCFDLVVTQGKTNVDRARVRLNEGIGMEKFSLNDKHSQISLWQDGQDFAVAYVNGATEMPVTFSASKDGTYTLTLEASNLDLDYLHLIDNLTGNDVDLLVTPSYTFEAKTTDYTSRFRLVFSNYEDTVGDNVTFAYFNDGNIVVNEEGTLQIVDMTGRVIVSRSGRIQCVPTTGMASGVYVLRLINTDGVKTQKIVVE